VSAEEDDLADCPQEPCSARLGTDQLTGWLKVVASEDEEAGGWDGWISLSGTDDEDDAEYGVELDVGEFSGFAWGGDIVGWLDFGYATTSSSPCEPTYQCTDVTHYDNQCAGTVENLQCGAGFVCVGGPVACSLPANANELQIHPPLVPTNTTTQVSWNVDHTASCRVYGDNGDESYGTGTGEETSSPITETTRYTLECANLLGTGTTTVDVEVASLVPTWIER
jgi:hypothetical protein